VRIEFCAQSFAPQCGRLPAAAEGSDAPMPDVASTTGPVAMTLAIVALLIGLGVLALLVLVLIGIHDEERHMSLTSAPRTRIGAVTRRLTGVGVRTPEAGPGKDQDPDSSPKAI
jgi:hypothetical protein